jgi:hypothetical protein
MSMRDIAGLARVQRPVVSVWRRRARATAHPFPAAHQHEHGQELFLRDEVVAWLEDTQRGNNPDVRADAASHSLLFNPGSEDAEALSGLLTLRHLTGEPLGGMTAEDLLDAADAQDPDDLFLFSELEQAGDIEALGRTADELVEAAWGEIPAHQRLMDTRLRPAGGGLAQAALTGDAQRFLLGIFAPLTRELGRPAVMDPTGCAVDVVPEVAATLDLPVRMMSGETAAHRLARRQLLLVDRPPRLVEQGSGEWSVTGPVAHLVVLPTPDAPTGGPLEHLNLLDEIALQLDEQQLVLCLAPGATLTDPLDGSALARRDQLMRDGVVRAIVRLPAGLRPAQAREHSALWLLGAADPTSAAERRTLVADLASRTLRDVGGLADDMLAAWQGIEGARRRAWAHLHPVLTRDLVSASGTLTPPRPARTTTRRRAGADWVVDLRAADTDNRLAGYQLDVLDQTPEEVTIAQATERGWVRVLPGRRVDLDTLPPGAVPVIDNPNAPATARTVDRLSLLARTDLELTEPGDIVFTARPTPGAIIDEHGGSLVLAPARILRLRPDAPLVARAIAARINTTTSTSWRVWTLAVIPEPNKGVLGEALTDLAAQRARLEAELAALDTLTTDLTTAVESRQLSITKENHGPTSH